MTKGVVNGSIIGGRNYGVLEGTVALLSNEITVDGVSFNHVP